MKRDIFYTVLVFVAGIIHLLIFLIAWKLKTGEAGLYTLIPVLLIISFGIMVILLLKIYGFVSFQFRKKEKILKPSEEPSPPSRETMHHREVLNPKTSVDKLLKNVMLKRSPRTFGEKLLSNFARGFDIVQGVFYVLNEETGKYDPHSFYAIADISNVRSFKPGESIPGQAALKPEVTVLKNIPDNYREIESGLGKRSPGFIYFIPLLHEKNCLAILEISTFREVSEQRLNALNYFISFGGKKFSQFMEKINV